MISFAWPWCFLVLPLPWLMRRFLPANETGTALQLPQLPTIEAASDTPRMTLPMILATLAWLLLVVAAARPQIPAERAQFSAGGRDLMLAFDVSASMASADLRIGGKPVERLQAARMLVEDFLRRRQGDRVGLIVFGTQAYLHTPLTLDLAAVRTALMTMETGFAGPETALGDAIGLAIKHLQPLADNSRELIILTDGTNTAGTLVPQRAAWLAQRAGVRIHAIGIGAARPVSPDSGAATTGLDEATLQQIATQSGGSYFRATDSSAFEEIFHRLDQNPPSTRDTAALQLQHELYAWPLALALVICAGLALHRIRGARA
jgi:Ca-activated chloride channel homolog